MSIIISKSFFIWCLLTVRLSHPAVVAAAARTAAVGVTASTWGRRQVGQVWRVDRQHLGGADVLDIV